MEKFVEEGKVKIVLEALGETKASKDISDSPYDKKNSVFSPSASKQRKVVIVGATSIKRKRKKKQSTNSLE